MPFRGVEFPTWSRSSTATSCRPSRRSALSLGDLEAIRDDLAARLHAARAVLHERGERQAAARKLYEAMLADPKAHRFVRLPRAEMGVPGCGAYEVRPRFGLIGMLAGWWHVKLSSGCPLAAAG
jgi:hypothetical protein